MHLVEHDGTHKALGPLMRVQQRRTNPFPSTWELPAGITLGWICLTVLCLPAGQSSARLLQTGRFQWPANLVVTISGLLHGDAGAGILLPAPSLILVYVCGLCLAGGVTAGSAWALRQWWITVGPLAQVGVAPAAEVAATVGRSSLRCRGRTIRPDLYAPRLPWRR
jgi:hypothetical protein